MMADAANVDDDVHGNTQQRSRAEPSIFLGRSRWPRQWGPFADRWWNNLSISIVWKHLDQVVVNENRSPEAANEVDLEHLPLVRRDAVPETEGSRV